MRKILCMILALVMCAAMLAGCGSNGNGKTNDTNPPSNSQNGEGTGNQAPNAVQPSAPTGEGVQITDAYTFTDPADLDFDARYVLYMGPENPAVQMAADSGLTAQYMIIYAKEETVLASYNLSVYETAEAAKAYAEGMAETNGTTVNPAEGDDTVMYTYSDAAAMELVLTSLKEAGLFSDTNASSFVQFQVDMNGMELLD